MCHCSIITPRQSLGNPPFHSFAQPLGSLLCSMLARSAVTLTAFVLIGPTWETLLPCSHSSLALFGDLARLCRKYCWTTTVLNQSPVPTNLHTIQPIFLDHTKPRPRAAFPTLISHPTSYAFRNEGPGTILYTAWGWNRCDHVTQLHAEERERCMGYLTNTTAAPGVTESQLRAMLGRAMDSNALKAIMHAVLTLAHLSHDSAATVCVIGGGKG